MGDIGSLALGSGLALMASWQGRSYFSFFQVDFLLSKLCQLWLRLCPFVICGKRIFKMAPLHHHFELLGWQEAKITVRFGIISFILCLLALITLKLR